MRKLIGLATMLALVLTTGGCTPLGGDTMTITARLADSAGLFVGNDVGILGVPVGRVTAIQPDGDGVEVTMEVDADRPVPADAGAVVVARSVATDRYVELTPVYRSGPRMQDGATIDQPRTRTPVDFDTVLSALDTLASGLSGEGRTANAIGRVLREGSRTLKGRGRDFNRAVTSLSAAVNGVAASRGDITGTLTALDRLTRTLAAHDDTVRGFTDQVTEASEMLASQRHDFRTAMNQLADAVELVARLAKDNKGELTRSLRQSASLMRTVLAQRKDLTEVLEVMPLTLENVQRAYHDGYVRVVMDPTLLTPLGGLVETLCTTAPVAPETCSIIGPRALEVSTVVKSLVETGQGLIGQLGGGGR